MPTDAERDSVEWAQHTALVAISVARTVLDLAEAAVTDRERLERLATTGRSFAEAWLGDAARIASTVVSGLGFETDANVPASGTAPAEQSAKRTESKPAAARAAGTVTKRPAKRATPRPPAKPAKAAKAGSKKSVKARAASGGAGNKARAASGGAGNKARAASGRAGTKAQKAGPARPKQRKR